MRNTQAKIPVVFILKDAALKKAEKSMGHLESRAKHFAKNLAGLALAGGIEEFARKSVEAAVKMEGANAKLGTALKNIGQSGAIGSEGLKKTQEKMASLGFTGADTSEALGNLVTATHSLSKAQGLMGQAADVARYKHISLGEASIKLAKASAGSAKGLAEFGIKLDKTLKPADAFKKAMAQLNAEISGQAQAYAGTYAGKLEILKAKFEEVQVQVGEKLLPKLIQLGDWFINTGLPKLQSFFKFIGDHVSVVGALAIALGTVATAFKMISIYAALAETAALPIMIAALPFVAAVAALAAAIYLTETASPTTKKVSQSAQAAGISKFGAPEALGGKHILTRHEATEAVRPVTRKGSPLPTLQKRPETDKVAAQMLASQKAANALAAKKAATDAAIAKAALVNKRLAAQFDMTQIQLAAALKGNLTQEQIDKVKALQSLEDDGYKTADQQLAAQQAALDTMLKTKQMLAQVDIMRSVTLTSGTGVSGGGSERAGGQGTGVSSSTTPIPVAIVPTSATPTSSVPLAPPPAPVSGITPAVQQMAAAAATSTGNAPGLDMNSGQTYNVSVNVAGSVTSESVLVDTIYNALNNKLRGGAAFYTNAASGL